MFVVSGIAGTVLHELLFRLVLVILLKKYR
jgi:hypothetical protein